jgi:MFS family permease
MSSADVLVIPTAEQRTSGRGFWTVAYTLLIVMAFATLPSPLYGLYRVRDNLSSFMITVIYAIFAGGVIVTLVEVRSLAARIGRRGVMLSAVATMMVAAGLLAAWKGLPELLIGRLITGISVGLASGTAVTYLIELRLRSNPKASMVFARTVGTSVTVGALGIGPLVAGLLAQWGKLQLTLPYLVWIGLGAVGLAGLRFAPETGVPAPRPTETSKPPRARLPIPAAAGTLAAFSANGLFAGLSGLFLATTLGHPSHALAGATLCLVFSAGVAFQLVTSKVRASTVLALGTVSMLIGLVLLVVSVRLSNPNLALFLIGGALIGGGSGALYKGTTGIVLEASAPQDRLALTSALLIALFVGLSVPVVGAGIALNQGATAPNTVLVFAIIVALAICASGVALLGGRSNGSE